MDASTLLTAASLIGAFGATTLTFRIQRELQVGDSGEKNWIPWADALMLVATIASFIVVASLLALRTTGIERLAAAGLAAAAVLAAGYPPAILAHYRLLPGSSRGGKRTNPEPPERWITYFSALVAIAAAIAAYCSASRAV